MDTGGSRQRTPAPRNVYPIVRGRHTEWVARWTSHPKAATADIPQPRWRDTFPTRFVISFAPRGC